jgi:hypothetical protein
MIFGFFLPVQSSRTEAIPPLPESPTCDQLAVIGKPRLTVAHFAVHFLLIFIFDVLLTLLLFN